MINKLLKILQIDKEYFEQRGCLLAENMNKKQIYNCIDLIKNKVHTIKSFNMKNKRYELVVNNTKIQQIINTNKSYIALSVVGLPEKLSKICEYTDNQLFEDYHVIYPNNNINYMIFLAGKIKYKLKECNIKLSKYNKANEYMLTVHVGEKRIKKNTKKTETVYYHSLKLFFTIDS